MIAVTGATGFIGQCFVRRMAAEALPVRALVRSPQAYEAPGNTEVIAGDIRDEDAVARLVEGAKVVVHTANLYQTQAKNVQEMREINVGGTAGLVEQACLHGVQRIVYLSTAGVHKRTGGWIDESTPINTHSQDPYEQQKIECEELLRKHGDQINHTILRPSTVYGPTDTRLQPLYQLIRSGRFFFIGSGTNHISWIYIDDLVDVMLSALRSPQKNGAYIVTGPDTLTFHELVSLISTTLGINRKPFSIPLFPFALGALVCESICPVLRIRPPLTRGRLRFFTDDLCYTSSKITELCFAPATAIAEGLQQTLNGFSKQ